MNKKSFLAAVLAFCLMLSLCACGGSEPTPDAAGTNTPAGNDATTPTGDNAGATSITPAPTDSAPAAPTPADGEVLYTIKVLDTDGNAKANVPVNLCNDEGCDFKITDAAGYAYFCKPEGEWKVAFSEMPEIYYYFEAGSREMTLVYDLSAGNTETEPSTNDVSFDEF